MSFMEVEPKPCTRRKAWSKGLASLALRAMALKGGGGGLERRRRAMSKEGFLEVSVGL